MGIDYVVVRMRRAWNIVFFSFFILCLFLFKPRQDVIFTAVDKTQYIRLFETGQDFELCVEEDNIFTGTYALHKDTVYLMYRERMDLPARKRASGQSISSSSLPKKLYINELASHIKSTDDHPFSAAIHMDMRESLRERHQVNILAAAR